MIEPARHDRGSPQTPPIAPLQGTVWTSCRKRSTCGLWHEPAVHFGHTGQPVIPRKGLKTQPGNQVEIARLRKISLSRDFLLLCIQYIQGRAKSSLKRALIRLYSLL